MSELLMFGVSGYPGVGKTTLARYMHKIYGFATYDGSDVLRNMARWYDVSLNGRESYDAFHRQLQMTRGMSFLADQVIDNPVGNRLAQIGVRARPDFERIKDLGRDKKIGARGLTLALIAPPEVCLPRMDPENPKSPKTIEEYLAHLALESSKDDYGSHAPYCIENADFKIDASGTILDTFGQFDDIMQRVAG